jgi:N-acyl amino acid synthase FeeM
VRYQATTKLKTSGYSRISGLTVNVATSRRDLADVEAIRRQVYIDEEKRVRSDEHYLESFDVYKSLYLIARLNRLCVGTIKIIEDSSAGLPCDSVVELASLRGPNVALVELGHLITAPGVRQRRVILELICAVLVYCVSICGATHVLGDIFFTGNKEDFDSHFYSTLGFRLLYGPYSDHRFLDAPQSLVMVLETSRLRLAEELAKGASKRVLERVNVALAGCEVAT